MTLPFEISEQDLFSFLAVLVRLSVVFGMVPLFGNRSIPTPIKILFSLVLSYILYPVLVHRGVLVPEKANAWMDSIFGIIEVISLEVVFGLIIGFTARLFFDAIRVGGDAIGTFMGFASAAQLDPSSNSQTQVVTQFHYALAMLIFLVFDGHHLMLGAILNSYQVVSIGHINLARESFSQKLIQYTSDVIHIGFRLAAPMALSMFSVNVVYGVIAKSMPQLNILILSFAVSAMVGFFVMFFTIPEYTTYLRGLFSHIDESLGQMMLAIRGQ